MDGLCLAAVGIPVLVIKYSVYPLQRGFYCSDTSLYYPYFSSSIPTSVNVTLSYGAPLVLIIARQIIKIKEGQSSSRIALRQAYRDITLFLFGVFTVQMVSGLCKVTAGRLRPHFIEVCQPSLEPSGSCGSWQRPEYVKNFTCLGNSKLFPDRVEMEHRMAESRLSFLSGHASLSWYGMVFGAGYLHISTTRERSSFTLPVVLIQVLMLVYAVVVSISRVTDNKHHPTDVLAGAVLGLSLALISLYKLVTSDTGKEYTTVHNSQSSTTNEEMLTKIS